MNDRRSAIVIALGLFAASETHAQNGGTSCATATTLVSGSSYTADTTAAPNWMNSFGPLVSPSNDVVYTYTLLASVPVRSHLPAGRSLQ